MKTTLKTALAFVALASITGTAVAQDRAGRPDRGGDRFERLDADQSGDISFEEFSAMMNDRLDGADADGNGTLTVEEVATQIQRVRAERQAKRMIDRFDANGDGQLTMDEVESRLQKRFALMDRNDDGKVSKDEMPRRGMGQKR